MSIVQIINSDYVGEYLDPARKENIAEAIMHRLLRENPFASQVNAASIRDLVMKVLDYNQTGSPDREVYKVCTSSTISIPIDGTPLTITGNSSGQVLKVCPLCKLTAEVEDPLCPNCNHVYYNHKLEAHLVQEALNRCAEKIEGAGNRNKVILNDEVEGIKVTKADMDKLLKDIEKYIP